MKKMHRILTFALLGGLSFAQTAVPQDEKPPADLEQTVRARVNQFYSMMKNHDYRKAEALIAEDTKDYYYAGSKPDIRKFEVLTIEFSDHFTHATAMTRCTEPVVVAGFPPTEITVNTPTLWKLEDGAWRLYEDPEKVNNPSGLRTKIQKSVDGATALTLPSMPKDLPTDPAFALGKLQIDRPQIDLAPETVERITVSNTSAGPVSLEPGYPLKGIEAKLDRTELPKGEKAVLTLTAGKEPVAGTYYLRVSPTGEVLAIQIKVK
jgi:hypothetical protein